MGNRIEGSTYIIDTGSGNTAIPWPSKMKVQAVVFWSTDTTGVMVLSGADTTNVTLRLVNPNNTPATVGFVLNGINFNNMKVPTLTSGTGWIYFN